MQLNSEKLCENICSMYKQYSTDGCHNLHESATAEQTRDHITLYKLT